LITGRRIFNDKESLQPERPKKTSSIRVGAPAIYDGVSITKLNQLVRGNCLQAALDAAEEFTAKYRDELEDATGAYEEYGGHQVHGELTIHNALISLGVIRDRREIVSWRFVTLRQRLRVTQVSRTDATARREQVRVILGTSGYMSLRLQLPQDGVLPQQSLGTVAVRTFCRTTAM